MVEQGGPQGGMVEEAVEFGLVGGAAELEAVDFVIKGGGGVVRGGRDGARGNGSGQAAAGHMVFSWSPEEEMPAVAQVADGIREIEDLAG